MQPFGRIRQIEFAGEDGLILYALGESLPEKNAVVQQVASAISAQSYPWLIEVVPSYDSVMLVFDMFQVDHHHVYQALLALPLVSDSDHHPAQHHCLPVWYGAPQANDLGKIAGITGLTERQIVEMHTSATYKAFAVGFTPGFAYLGEINTALSVPRMAKPRTKVPAGAVAIADRQTAVYPSKSPGGWHLLGLCPVPLYRPEDNASVLINAGDTVSFEAVSRESFIEIASQHNFEWDIHA